MATYGPPSSDDAVREHSAMPSFSAARLLLLQRALATITHELGNMTSPVALVADVFGSNPSPAQQAGAAGTLRLVADALRTTTSICRMLRGNQARGALSPPVVSHAAQWWTLLEPFIAEMVPLSACVRGNMAAVPLDPAQSEALVWSTLAAALFAATTRSGISVLTLTGAADAGHDRTLIVQIATTAPRITPATRVARELRRLAQWETARVGGSVTMTSTSSRFECRITLPPCPD